MRAAMLLALAACASDAPIAPETRVDCGNDPRYQTVEGCHPYCLRTNAPDLDDVDECRFVRNGTNLFCPPGMLVDVDGELGCCPYGLAIRDDAPYIPCGDGL